MSRPYLFQARELYHALFEVEAAVSSAFLLDWANQNREILAPFADFRAFNGLGNFYRVGSDDLHSLYALSRICDLLCLPFQPPRHDSFTLAFSHWDSESFALFWKELGIESQTPTAFHPFWCEIAACRAAGDPHAKPEIEKVLWPALRFGDLLVCRAGVEIVVGASVFDLELAQNSPLYFAFTRATRKAHDLSHGWGHNSQWGTDFRRDYVWNGRYVFNADGAIEIGETPFLNSLSFHEILGWPPVKFLPSQPGSDEGLRMTARLELLLHRCFVQKHEGLKLSDPEGDYWPYHDTAVMAFETDVG